MKATELRVNNLVHFSLSNIVRVESINTHTCICKAKYSRSGKDIFEDMISFSGDTASGNAPIESFWGIPLTEEILLKCGFKYYKENNSYQLDFGFYCIWGRLEKEFTLYSNGDETETEIKYLHQLQNLYWCLTGQELEVNL